MRHLDVLVAWIAGRPRSEHHAAPRVLNAVRAPQRLERRLRHALLLLVAFLDHGRERRPQSVIVRHLDVLVAWIAGRPRREHHAVPRLPNAVRAPQRVERRLRLGGRSCVGTGGEGNERLARLASTMHLSELDRSADVALADALVERLDV